MLCVLPELLFTTVIMHKYSQRFAGANVMSKSPLIIIFEICIINHYVVKLIVMILVCVYMQKLMEFRILRYTWPPTRQSDNSFPGHNHQRHLYMFLIDYSWLLKRRVEAHNTHSLIACNSLYHIIYLCL